MDKDISESPDNSRDRALDAIKATRWVPPQGEKFITGMVESRPDWVISRQRAWGVPITVFVREHSDGSVEILKDDRVDKRTADAFEQEGADAWYAPGARERFLGELANEAGRNNSWQKVDDILDVWFKSSYRPRLRARRPRALSQPRRDQAPEGRRQRHRDVSRRLTTSTAAGSSPHCWESCGTRGVRSLATWW